MQNDSPSSILCVGEDPELLKTRAAVLRSAGAAVEWSLSRNALETLRQRCFDAIVVCHTVKCADAGRIFEAAHMQYAGALVVRVMPFWVGESLTSRNSFDAVVSAEPAVLVSLAQELVQRRARSAA